MPAPADSVQSDNFSVANRATGVAVQMFAPEQIPVKHAVAKQFGVFVRPTPSLSPGARIRVVTSSGGLAEQVFHLRALCEHPQSPLRAVRNILWHPLQRQLSVDTHCWDTQPQPRSELLVVSAQTRRAARSRLTSR